MIQWLLPGGNGFDVTRGASAVSPGQARLKEKLIPLADKVAVLADHTKLDQRSPYFFAKNLRHGHADHRRGRTEGIGG